MTRKLFSTQIEVPAGMINFGVGQPGASVLPMEIMRQAAQHRFSQDDSLLLNYGPEQGDGPFLQALATFLSDAYDLPVDPLSLMTTGGASQALNMICTFFTQPGDTIFVEEPTYFIAPCIFRDHGLNLVTVPTDENGMIIEVLETLLVDHQPSFVYTIPAYQNPTGVTLSPERRQRLVELSLAHDFLIVADEVYHLLNFADEPPPPLAAMIESGTVLSVGSFSKILAPGLRLGWIQAGPELIDRLVDIQFVFSGGALNQFTSHLVRSALELGLQQQHLENLRNIYAKRSKILCAAIREHLGDIVQLRDPDGGFFVWVELPSEMDANALMPLAAKHDVSFQPGVNFSSHHHLHNFMRFCFAHYEQEDLAEGVRRLATVLTKG